MGQTGKIGWRGLAGLALGVAALAGLAALAAWQAGWLGAGQALPGRKVDYYKTHPGGWEVACDTAPDGTGPTCYIQNVEVYRPRPDFAAAMVELVMHPAPDGPDPHIRFDIEPGLSFARAEVILEAAETATSLNLSHCPSNTCRFSGAPARAILDSWRQGTALILVIDEGRSTPARLSWSLAAMPAILDDFAARRTERNLP